MKKIIYLLFLILFVFMSCTTGDKNFDLEIIAPDVIENTESAKIVITGNLIGVRSGTLELVNEYNERIIKTFGKVPETIDINFEKPGDYSLKASAISLLDGKKYEVYKTNLFVVDPSAPLISDIWVIPKEIFVGDDVILYLKVNSSNSKINVKTEGLERYGISEISKTVNPGEVFLDLGSFNEPGDKEFYIKVDNLLDSNYSTKVTLNVLPIDNEAPLITIESKFSYPTNSNILIKVNISDDVKLSSYEVYLDGESKLKDTVEQKELKGIPVQLNKLEPGDHSLIVKATDWLGKKSMIGKRILIGDTYLNFEIAISNENSLIPGHSTIIAVVPTEENINFRKIVYFIDGEEFFETTNQTFVQWTVEEGQHYITVYAEDENGRAGINERYITVEDNNAPKLMAMSINGKVISKTESSRIPVGNNVISVLFEDAGGISKTSTPVLYIKEDHYSEYYNVLEMKLSEISADEKQATFTVNTSIGYGYFYLFVKGLKDKEGNEYMGEDVFTVITGY
ncbi:hypothetical protein SU69_03510 [Thermosipho melanesiensis]|uniref:Uncharacterized protein n=2 Tax=Thermosipho melanesiensis TaxID=46541 RepID=A6LKU3_THEM4|nr:hypothetical protein [Thermosipho melanesiensis]ABR30544.1 hypothetical protein Tmel_0680 [Thermosipho melanesiensis BI429]APT73693.1 hypothetical protein BW47_03695 [Thermosipho melanesiensis]OOC35632.1 hypothetical protein SU68_03565 [Thermosipho melanesiensis]OOC39307.1 hypothetical protein SU69_03510 [Thermosipho melanesiensis]OOC39393.1 hypothetical protein SU70_03510 [Thermosipho melanesiensis]